MISNWEEKRRFPRIHLKAPLRCQERGLPDFSNTTSDDISEGGLSFVNDRFIAPKGYLNLEINLTGHIISTPGLIVHVNTLAHADKYRLGIKFTELEQNQKKFLSDYINMRISTFGG